MEWFIKKKSTLPVFQVEISQNGRSDFNRVENLSGVTSSISLYDETNDLYRVTSKECYITASASTTNSDDIIYYLNYQFTNREVSKEGRFKVQINLSDSNGDLVLPLKESIFVNIIDSFSQDYTSYNNDYVIVRPCC
jgi:hypothetical protein